MELSEKVLDDIRILDVRLAQHKRRLSSAKKQVHKMDPILMVKSTFLKDSLIAKLSLHPQRNLSKNENKEFGKRTHTTELQIDSLFLLIHANK